MWNFKTCDEDFALLDGRVALDLLCTLYIVRTYEQQLQSNGQIRSILARSRSSPDPCLPFCVVQIMKPVYVVSPTSLPSCHLLSVPI